MSKKLKVYTKSGDKGTTALIGGKRISKADLQVEAYGNVDELKSHIALLSDLIDLKDIKEELQEIIVKLFITESLIASADVPTAAKMPQLKETDIEFLESRMDAMEENLPPLKAFVLPGGHVVNSQINIARAICRKTERSCIRFWDRKPKLFNPMAEKYLNRLSDYLFTLSRFWNIKNNISEVLWLP